MTGLAFIDTNIIVRYLTGTPQHHADRAAEIIDHTDRLLVSAVSLAEVYFVLEKVYRVPKDTVIGHLIDFILKKNVTPYAVEKDLLIEGLRLCRGSGRVGVPDALIWAEVRTAGAGTVYSFDERFPDNGVNVRA